MQIIKNKIREWAKIWKVPSKSDKDKMYEVMYIFGSEEWMCDCIAGKMGQECSHKKIIKQSYGI